MAHYVVLVDYECSVEAGARACRVKLCDTDINSRNFPPRRKGKRRAVIELIRFKRFTTSTHVCAEFRRRDLQPAELRELFALAKKLHELGKRKISVAGLGSAWRDKKRDIRVPFFVFLDSKRYADLGWRRSGWDKGWQFAGVRRVRNRPRQSTTHA